MNMFWKNEWHPYKVVLIKTNDDYTGRVKHGEINWGKCVKKGQTPSDREEVCEIMTVLGEDDDEW